MEELLDALLLLRDRDDPTASAVMVTGMGGIFCQGLDLAALTHQGHAEKQRKSAEALAGCVSRLVSCLLNYPKMTVAAVNGLAVGLAVTILPYFDLVYASDTAVFRTDYVRLGQVRICTALANTTSNGIHDNLLAPFRFPKASPRSP